MNNGTTKARDRQTLKRKYLECFDVRTTNAANWKRVVLGLIDCGISRETLVNWAVNAGHPKTTVSSTVSRVLCAIGIRDRRQGAGRKPSPEGIALLNHARCQYGDRCLKVLRAAIRAGKTSKDFIQNFSGEGEQERSENNCRATIRLPRKLKSRLRINGTILKKGFNATIKPSHGTRIRT
jgi:hypothetical protein